ncbi:MAG: hypothetical protein ABIV47_17455, partial [Roseiflexaceae bacterium]
ATGGASQGIRAALMTVSLYMDVHILRAIMLELHLHSVDVITSQEDNSARFRDPDLLDRLQLCSECLLRLMMISSKKRKDARLTVLHLQVLFILACCTFR